MSVLKARTALGFVFREDQPVIIIGVGLDFRKHAFRKKFFFEPESSKVAWDGQILVAVYSFFFRNFLSRVNV